ncbi:MFS transporter [Legionella oakridgensis]|uniref:MFS transporter n=1 Tax=Legionella oakridgensis TaxID=29423 RepID=UPI0003DE1347|nr:MFS transporter [Legionella oakridgensis]ETO93951.1 arabinose efflux permease [Legionella oakridgensis RV-2-2007]
MNLLNPRYKPLYFSTSMRFLTQASQYFYYVLMPILVVGLSSQPQLIKLTVSVFFFGLSVSLFFSGPLIDTLGVPKSFWLGLFIFLIGTVICAFSEDVYTMMVGRLVQAIAVGILQILSKSMISSSSERTTFFVIYCIFVSFSPTIAMLATSLILYFFSWQASFVFLLILSVFVLGIGVYGMEKNTEQPSLKKHGKIRLKTYLILLKETGFIPLILSYSTVNAVSAPFYVTITYTLVHVLHYQPHVIGLISAVFTVVGVIGTSLSLLVEKTSYKRHVMNIGFGLSFLGCFLLFLCAVFFPPSILAFVLPLAWYILGSNFFYAKFNTYIIEQFEHVSKNIALSSMAIGTAAVSSLATFICSFHGHETIMKTAFLMFGMVVLSIGFYWHAVTRMKKNKQ